MIRLLCLGSVSVCSLLTQSKLKNVSLSPDGTHARTHAEKCDALRDTLYQRPPHIEGLDEPDLAAPHPEDIPYRDVTRHEVVEAIFGPDPSKAPGDEGERERDILQFRLCKEATYRNRAKTQ